MKTLIAVPCMDTVAAPFAQNLAAMEKVGDCEVGFIVGSLIYDSRNSFGKHALSGNFDYILWLDSDMTFPPDLMVRMVEHMKDKDFVSGLYFRRRNPFTPVLFSELGAKDGVGYHKNFDEYPKDSVFEIAGCGFGCVMMKREVLEDVLLNCKNWFEPMYGFGEDLSFCLRAKSCDYKIWCDSTIKCGHVGQVIVDENVYLSSIKG